MGAAERTVGFKLLAPNWANPRDGQTRYRLGETTRHPRPSTESRGLVSDACGPDWLHAWHEPEFAADYVNGYPIPDMHLCRCDCSRVLATDGRKFGCAEITPVEELPISRVFGSAGEQLIALLRELPTFPWLKATGAEDAEAESLAQLHLERLKVFGFSQDIKPVVKPMTLAAARDATRHAAWHAAWDAARHAAWHAAWHVARDAARDAARRAAWDAAWDAAWHVVWDAARDAARDAAYRSVEDFLPSKANPFEPLTYIWRLGYYPVGVSGFEFVIARIERG